MRTAVGLLGTLLLMLGGCGPEDGTPRLGDPHLLHQSPADEWTLVFEVAFEDSDGDLGRGSFVTALHESYSSRTFAAPTGEGETVHLPLDGYFERNGLPLDATSGRLRFDVTLPRDGRLQEGEQFAIGIQVEDGAGHASEEAIVFLEMSYRPPADGELERNDEQRSQEAGR